MEHIFHIVRRADWRAARAAGTYRAESLNAEGFIHCSFADQVAGVANARYADVDGLCVLEVDPARLDSRVVVEDSYASGTAFPHIYGPIPVDAVVAVHDLNRDVDGDYRFDGR